MRDRGRGPLLQVVEETLLSAYRTESCVLKHPEELGQAWLDLQDRADCSYFLSWGWIGTWLRQINNKANKPFIFYLHPWEIDADQPRIQAGWLSRFRHYNNLDKCESRLRILMSEFQFTTTWNVLKDLELVKG